MVNGNEYSKLLLGGGFVATQSAKICTSQILTQPFRTIKYKVKLFVSTKYGIPKVERSLAK